MKRALIASCIIGLAVFATAMPKSDAYQTYSQNGDATNCGMCHGDFRDSPYVSLSDGQNWGNDLHDIHRNTMLNGDCDTCHSGGEFPVDLDSSDGGDGLEAISCVGCHGRNEDIGNDSSSAGRAAGLRQHHSMTGTTSCVGCHSDADPANYTPVSEDVLPSYYSTPDSAHPDKPSDSCNPNGEEDYAGIAEGLDNDGDDVYDTNDPDCGTVCGNGIIEAGEECDDGNTLDGDCCSATCQDELCAFNLISPENGLSQVSPPTFQWTAGPYDVLLFYSVFNYTGFGYYPASFWLLNSSLSMSLTWWNAVSENIPSYWAVIGINTTTSDWEVAGPWSFTKTP
jgi:cysteine-rich repeat protein